MTRTLLVHALIFAFSIGYCREPFFRIAPPFGDNMVIQQKRVVPFFGKGTPGSTISIQTSWGKSAATEVTADGSWMAKLRTPVAGGPHQIDVRHDDTVLTLRNVLVGEVWLCSGQSNMEMPLEGWPPDSILNSAAEIRHSSYPGIRLFNVKRAFSATPESDCAGKWEECSPATSPTFSATAYFFGRKLHQSLNVPIGLILSSWGGTPVEAWTSAEFLRRVPELDTTLEKVRLSADGMKAQVAWVHQFPVIDVSARVRATKWQNLTLDDDSCSARQFDDSRWRIMRLPTVWEKAGLGEFDGVVWFRKEVAIPTAWVHRDLIVELGPVDDMDVTFVNGQKVGGHETEGLWKAERVYRVPKSLVDTTTVCIAVRVIDYGGGGGIYGEAKTMSIHPEGQDEHLSLAGDWRFLPVAEYRADRLFVFGSQGERFFERPALPIDFSAYTPTSLFNGMISPLVPFSLAGVIWYQGEANAGAPMMYKKLFPLMIENWRSVFGDGTLPFYFVQLAPYDYGEATKSQLLREAQRMTLAVRNTGMAVTLDIGNPSNIHPANKQEVGQRLALWALAKSYGKKLEYSGPLYRSIKKFEDRVEVTFDHAPNGLVLIGREGGNGFLIAGEDREFKPADVRVIGRKLVVSSVEIAKPQAVRYAFRNTAEATLFNTAGLPAPSFRTDEWSR